MDINNHNFGIEQPLPLKLEMGSRCIQQQFQMSFLFGFSTSSSPLYASISLELFTNAFGLTEKKFYFSLFFFVPRNATKIVENQNKTFHGI